MERGKSIATLFNDWLSAGTGSMPTVWAAIKAGPAMIGELRLVGFGQPIIRMEIALARRVAGSSKTGGCRMFG